MASSMRCSFLCASLLLWAAISASSLDHDLSMERILNGILEDSKAGKHTLLKLKDVEDGKAFLIGDGGDSYDYSDGPLGPANWGNLTSEWKICGDGDLQSPIDIEENQVHLGNTSGIATYYNWAIGELNLDSRIKIVFKVGGGSLYWNEYGPYKVVEVHWHTPSEHTINGERFPLESHTVHQGPNGEILVVGRLYTFGTEDSFLASIMKWESSSRTFNVIKLDNAKTDYYNYMGSLTTPPCTEGVTWIVRAEILTASTDQVDFFLSMNKGDNARPLQALNDRSIYFYQVNNIMMMK